MKQLYFLLIAFLLLAGCDKASDTSALNAGGAGTGGSLARFTITANHLYTVDKQDLKVYDITDGAQPVFKRTIPVGFEIETIFPFKDKLFIGSTSRVYIFSLADPSNPQKQGEAISPEVMRRCDPVVAKDTVAYATLRTNGACGGTMSVLAAYDVRDVQNPVQKKLVEVGSPYGLAYSGNTLYVCDQQRGILVFDISSAYDPLLKKQVPLSGSYPIDVIPVGNVLVVWTTKGMTLYDITNRINPVLITNII